MYENVINECRGKIIFVFYGCLRNESMHTWAVRLKFKMLDEFSAFIAMSQTWIRAVTPDKWQNHQVLLFLVSLPMRRFRSLLLAQFLHSQDMCLVISLVAPCSRVSQVPTSQKVWIVLVCSRSRVLWESALHKGLGSMHSYSFYMCWCSSTPW